MIIVMLAWVAQALLCLVSVPFEIAKALCALVLIPVRALEGKARRERLLYWERNKRDEMRRVVNAQAISAVQPRRVRL